MSTTIGAISNYVGGGSLTLNDQLEIEQNSGPTSGRTKLSDLIQFLLQSQTVGDANASITGAMVLLTAALTASRTYTLPAANSIPAGKRVRFADMVGTITGTNTAVIARAGSDTINGGTSYTIATAYGIAEFTSDGVSKWTITTRNLVIGSTVQAWSSVLDALSGLGNVSADGNDLVLALDASAAAPGSNKVKLFGTSVGGSIMPGWMDAAGVVHATQPLLGMKHVATMTPLPSSATVPTVSGFGNATNVGTATARAIASTGLFTSVIRFALVSAATAGSSSQFRSSQLLAWLGNAAGLGGFRCVFNWGNSDAAAVANARGFVGLTNPSGDLANGNPSALTNIIGVGNDTGDANMQFMHNDGSGTATKVDLGSNFPANSLNTDWFQLQLFSAPNSGTVSYVLINKTTGNSTSGSASSDLPSNTTFLQFVLWRNNGTTALAVGLDIGVQHVETNY